MLHPQVTGKAVYYIPCFEYTSHRYMHSAVVYTVPLYLLSLSFLVDVWQKLFDAKLELLTMKIAENLSEIMKAFSEIRGDV